VRGASNAQQQQAVWKVRLAELYLFLEQQHWISVAVLLLPLPGKSSTGHEL
jgi:hypothetical protein